VALPARVPPAGPDQVDVVPLAGGDELVGADVGGVHQVLGRGRALGRERIVDRRRARRLVHVGRRRVGVQHKARGTLVAALGQVDHVARPAHAALRPEARLGVVGRFDAIAGAASLRGAQPHAAVRPGCIAPGIAPLEVARPDAAQGGDSGQHGRIRRRIRPIQRVE
jgi:hypothetical protein